jgi:serine/threonine protein kinase/tetratricopeptide (TPR) repeat protein
MPSSVQSSVQSSMQAESAGTESVLDEVIAAYLEALEKEPLPDRDDWLARYPQLADALSDFFADQDQVRGWTAPLRTAAEPVSSASGDPNQTLDVRATGASPSPLPLSPAVERGAVPVGRFGDYVLLAEIARGGMGVVYRARQVSLNRTVAIKMILAGARAGRTDLARFRTEAEAAAQLDHPNIVPIYEVSAHEGQPFFSMKLVDGGSLAMVIGNPKAAGGRPWQRWAAGIVEQVARGVDFAHQRGILHRDLKPANILLQPVDRGPWSVVKDRAVRSMTTDGPRITDYYPLITDFGLAKLIDHDSNATQSGAVVGTPSYMAPEQAMGQKVLTTAADTYSLGAILYALLTGQPPFRAATPLETMRCVVTEAPPRPRTLNAQVDRDLETICLKCLEKAPADRYASAAALADDLHCYLQGESIQARPAGPAVRVWKWVWRRPAAAALLAVSAIALVSVLGGYLQYDLRRSDSSRHHEHALRLLDQGEQAMQRGQLLEARGDLTSAQRLVAADDTELHARLTADLQEIEHRLLQQARQAEADTQFRTFMNLRDIALFQATPAGSGDGADTGKLHATVQSALAHVAVAETYRDLLTADNRTELHEGRYELLLILAEALAQARPPRLDEALRLLDQAEAAGKPTVASRLQRARYLRQPGAELAKLVPGGAFDHFLLGQDLRRHGRLLEAAHAFARVLDVQPRHFWARYLLGVCCLQLEPSEPARARDHLNVCLGQERGTVWVHVHLGIARLQLREFDAALADFRTALDLLDQTPNDEARYTVLFNRGALYHRRQQPALALAELRQASALRPLAYQPYANRAAVHEQQREFGTAVEQLTQAIARADAAGPPALARLLRARARLQLRCDDRVAALADVRTAQMHDRGAPNQLECGRLLHDLKHHEEALAAYAAALQVRDMPEVHLERARTLVAVDEYKQARAAFDSYLKNPGPAKDAELAYAYRMRGQMAALLEQYTEAIDDFTLALSHEKDATTLTHRGWAYLVKRAPSLAVADFERAIALEPKHAVAHIGLGAAGVQLAGTLSDYQNALKSVDKALRVGPKKDALLRCKVARVYAGAAARLGAAPDGAARDGAALRRVCIERVVQVLQEAIDLTDAAEQSAFWRKYIQTNPDLAGYAAAVRWK